MMPGRTHLSLAMQHKEPRGPRPVCDLLLEKLASAESEVVQLIQDTGQAAGRDARGNRSATSIRCCFDKTVCFHVKTTSLPSYT